MLLSITGCGVGGTVVSVVSVVSVAHLSGFHFGTKGPSEYSHMRRVGSSSVSMLFGVVKLDAVYKTPDGAVLATNVVSEVVVGNAYCILALVGALNLLCCAKDTDTSGHYLEAP